MKKSAARTSSLNRFSPRGAAADDRSAATLERLAEQVDGLEKRMNAWEQSDQKTKLVMHRLTAIFKKWETSSAQRIRGAVPPQGIANARPSPPKATAPDTHPGRSLENGERAQGPPDVTPPNKAPPKDIYLESLADGQYHPGRWYSLQDAAALQQHHNFDFIINEIMYQLTINAGTKKGTISTNLIGPNLLAFLHLVLTHILEPLTYPTIGAKLGLSDRDLACRDNAIHQTRRRFNDLVGSLQGQIFGQSKNRCYCINPQGWSFCWLRKVEDSMQSELLRAIRQRKPLS